MDLAARLVEVMMQKRLPLYVGPHEANIIYVEGMNPDGSANANTPNEFNDIRTVLSYVNGKPTIVGIWEATTEPGRKYTFSPINPNGAARIALGYHKDVWQVGTHMASKPSGHEALVQTGDEVTVYRDLNKDFKRDGDKPDTGWFGINQHWGYDLPKGDIGGASAGCLVGRTKAGHQQFMTILKNDPRYLADSKFKFSATVLEAAEVAGQVQVRSTVLGTPILISQAAIDLIVREEVSSQAAYNSRYRNPIWPGGNSGVTIGIGYDIGAGVTSRQQLHTDWEGKISDDDVDALEAAIGVTGVAADTLAARLQDVEVSWEAAMSVFEHVDVPRWYATCKKVLPNFELLPPDSRGALVSIAYNRGPSFADTTGNSRYTEMRNIRTHMISKEFDKIPDEIRAMKRIWRGQGLDGLLRRRDAEAALFEKGLNAPKAPEVIGTGTVIAGGTTAVAVAVHQGADWSTIAAIGIFAAVGAFVVYKFIRARRKKGS